MTIFHDGIEKENIPLQDIDTEPEMHQLMLSKGFKLKSDDELALLKAKNDELRQKELEKKEKREKRRRERELLDKNKENNNNDDDVKKNKKELDLDYLNKKIKVLEEKTDPTDEDKGLLGVLTKRRTKVLEEIEKEKQQEKETVLQQKEDENQIDYLTRKIQEIKNKKDITEEDRTLLKTLNQQRMKLTRGE